MLKKIFIIGICVLFLGFGYYAFSPIFKPVYLDEEVPMAQTASSSTEVQMETQYYPIVETVGHPAEGKVRLIESSEGTIIRYEDFKTINGPDLYVYLSKDLEGKEFVNLGALRGTEGNVNYTVPEGVDISEYRYVMVWCKQFGVLFNYADLGTSIMSSDDSVMEDLNQNKSNATPSIPVLSETQVLVENDTVREKTALLANGCFWCVEHDLEEVRGVRDVVSGYAGGSTKNPTYKNYAEGGHREVVLVTYDANLVSFSNLVEHIIKHGDPTDADGSFGDRGPEYAPAIYYENDFERDEARRVISAIDAMKVFDAPLPLAVLPRAEFWPAEAYHQDYSEKNPIRYSVYRNASGRDAFIKKQWGDSVDTFVVPSQKTGPTQGDQSVSKEGTWNTFVKPSDMELRKILTPLQFEVTQEDGTEHPFTNAYDKNYAEGIYVDIVSGEPLFFSNDKYDSGTGWPSFVKPISDDVVVLHEDNTLFSTRTEVRSRYADSHLGHVFDDGPKDRGGKRYCMNSAALRFIPRSDMEKEGYAYLLPYMNT